MEASKDWNVIIVDALGSGSGIRHSSKDAVGCGPRQIAGILESHDLNGKIVLAEHVIRSPSLLKGFDILMVSAMSVDSKAVERVIRCWRRNRGSKPAIIGGPITGRPEPLLKLGFDIVIVGNGESSLPWLLKNNRLTSARNTIIRDGVKFGVAFSSSGHYPSNADFGKSYSQTREELNCFSPSVKCIRDYPVYRALKFYVEVARGCSNFLRTKIPLPDGRKCLECEKCGVGELECRIECPANIPPGCGFCSVPSVFGYSRSKNEDGITREVSELIKTGVRRIVLSASDFLDYGRDRLVSPHPLTDPGHPPANITAIESLLSRLASLQSLLKVPGNDTVYMSVENIKPCLFDEEAARVIAQHLPNSTVHFGCETGSEEHSNRLGRPSTPAQTLDAVRRAKRHGLRPYVYFIHGLPGQDARTATETVRIMEQMSEAGAEKITLYRFKPLPLSAFELFPIAPAAKDEPNSKRIESVARQLNTKCKEKLLGKTIEVIAFKSADGNERKGVIAYPVAEGPVVLLTDQKIKEGKRLKARITEVLSDRLVRGEIY